MSLDNKKEKNEQRNYTLHVSFSEEPSKEEIELIELLISNIGEPKRVINVLKFGYKRKLWDLAAHKKGRKNLVKTFVKYASEYHLKHWDLTKKALESGVIFGYPMSRTTIWRIKKAIEEKFRTNK